MIPSEELIAAVRRILDEPEDTLAMAQSRERYWSRRCADAEAERDAAAALARKYRDTLDRVHEIGLALMDELPDAFPT